MGKGALVVRALYGVKADGRDLWNHLRSFMIFWGFKSKGGETDVWMHPSKKKDGTLVY